MRYHLCFIVLGSSESSYVQIPLPNRMIWLLIFEHKVNKELHHFVGKSDQLKRRSPIQSRNPFESLFQPQ